MHQPKSTFQQFSGLTKIIIILKTSPVLGKIHCHDKLKWLASKAFCVGVVKVDEDFICQKSFY